MLRRLRMTATALVLAALAAGCGEKAKEESAPPVPLEVNLLTNPSFEDWRGNIPVGWEIQHFEGPGTTMNLYGKSIDEKASGSSAFYLRGTFNVDRWMVLVQKQRVMPGYRLTLAGQTKGQDLKKNRGQFERANMYVRFYDKDGKSVRKRYYADSFTRPLVGTTSWLRSMRRVDVPKNAWYAEIGLICQMTGWIYFDDVEAVLEEPIPWKEIQKKYVNYYYLEGNPFPSGAVEKEDAFIENCVKKLGLKVENKVGYYYYPSDDKFREITGRKSGHERAMWKRQQLHTTRPYDDHEMIHMLLVPLGSPPFGLCEGAVFYVLGSWENGRDLHMMAKDLLTNKKLPALYMLLDRREMERIGLDIAVPGWASFSSWLIDRHGIEKFMKLYAATSEIQEPIAFNVHFKDVYGTDFDVMDRDWRLWVLRYQPRR